MLTVTDSAFLQRKEEALKIKISGFLNTASISGLLSTAVTPYDPSEIFSLHRFKELLTETDSAFLQGKEEALRLKISGLLNTAVTLYDALEIFSLHRFKELLTEAGFVDLLKQRSPITVIAPIDEAFHRIHPLMESELRSSHRSERIQTLARAHLVPFRSLLDAGAMEAAVEPRYDMNGDKIELVLEPCHIAGLPNRILPGGAHRPPVEIVHAINGVRPLEPFPGGTRFSNGRLIVVSDVIFSNAFFLQKYLDLYRRLLPSPDKDYAPATLWECFKALGLTRFCQIVEDAGFTDLLKGDHDPAAKPWIVAPVDEAFFNLQPSFLEYLDTPQGKEHFVEAHIGDKSTFSQRGANRALGAPASKFKALNGNFALTVHGLDHSPVGWDLVPIPIRHIISS